MECMCRWIGVMEISPLPLAVIGCNACAPMPSLQFDVLLIIIKTRPARARPRPRHAMRHIHSTAACFFDVEVTTISNLAPGAGRRAPWRLDFEPPRKRKTERDRERRTRAGWTYPRRPQPTAKPSLPWLPAVCAHPAVNHVDRVELFVAYLHSAIVANQVLGIAHPKHPGRAPAPATFLVLDCFTAHRGIPPLPL